MNWKLIIQLSFFGLAMGIATVFVIPSTIEPVFWLAVFLVSAYFIATRCTDRYFLHGLLVSIANSLWITAIHFLLFNRYVAGHQEEVAMMKSLSTAVSPRVMMALMGPITGVISGLVLGLFAVVASKFLSVRKSS